MNFGKDTFYFPHDSNAKDDPKIVLLIEQLGLEGYGIYWVLIETLRDQPTYSYPMKLLPALARRYATTKEKIEAVVKGYGLFEVNKDEFFLSPSLSRRMAAIDDKRKRLSLAGKRGREKQLSQTDAGHPRALSGPPPGKERKRKERKRKATTPPARGAGGKEEDVSSGTEPQEAVEIAQLMADSILQRDPNYSHLINGKRERTLNQWAEDVDKIHRIDKREWGQIRTVAEWCMHDDFWCRNILSGRKLRDQFNQLVVKSSGGGTGTSSPHNSQGGYGTEKVMQ